MCVFRFIGLIVFEVSNRLVNFIVSVVGMDILKLFLFVYFDWFICRVWFLNLVILLVMNVSVFMMGSGFVNIFFVLGFWRVMRVCLCKILKLRGNGLKVVVSSLKFCFLIVVLIIMYILFDCLVVLCVIMRLLRIFFCVLSKIV